MNVVWKVEAPIEDVEITVVLYVRHLVQIIRVLERVNIKGAQTMIRLYVFFFKFLIKKNLMCIMTAFESIFLSNLLTLFDPRETINRNDQLIEKKVFYF